MAPHDLVLDPSSMMGLSSIMDEIMFEPKDILTLATISSLLRKIAPGPWTMLGWADTSSSDAMVVLGFNTQEDRIQWQLTYTSRLR